MSNAEIRFAERYTHRSALGGDFSVLIPESFEALVKSSFSKSFLDQVPAYTQGPEETSDAQTGSYIIFTFVWRALTIHRSPKAQFGEGRYMQGQGRNRGSLRKRKVCTFLGDWQPANIRLLCALQRECYDEIWEHLHSAL